MKTGLDSLKRRDGQWSGQASWGHSPLPFALTIYRADEELSPADRSSYEALTRDYPALRPSLQSALLDLWNGSAGAAERSFGGASELWSKLVLQGVGLYPDGHAELIYGFAAEDDPEGAFMVSVRGQAVEPLEYID